MCSVFPSGGRRALLLTLVLVSGPGCERETRRFREVPPTATPGTDLRLSTLNPGPPVLDSAIRISYVENAYAVSEGKRLFSQFNCVGCHAQGGGAMGPPLMDDEWIYGAEPEHIFATIVEGRPNGMPAFGSRLATSQVWQLAAYIRSMSGLVRKDVAPGRADAMQAKAQEQATTEQRPVESTTPPQAERP
jgi:cytochrome c oxidase cbb3-type subunit III